jgi:hypothetical protein
MRRFLLFCGRVDRVRSSRPSSTNLPLKTHLTTSRCWICRSESTTLVAGYLSKPNDTTNRHVCQKRSQQRFIRKVRNACISSITANRSVSLLGGRPAAIFRLRIWAQRYMNLVSRLRNCLKLVCMFRRAEVVLVVWYARIPSI